MKKRSLLAFVLILSMCIPTFAACGIREIQTETTTTENVETTEETTTKDATTDPDKDEATEPSFSTSTTVPATEPTTTEPETDTPALDLPDADSALSIPQAIEIGLAMEHNIYTEGKYFVTGTIKTVYNATYGNMILIDANGNELTVYGTWSADGETRYDKLGVAPVAGDTITVYGIVGQYNGNAQVKDGWIVVHIPAAPEVDETTEAPAGETTEAPADETTEAPAGETTEAPAGETTEAPAGETTEAPAGETTEAPANETTEAPANETTEAPETDAPEVDYEITIEEAIALGVSMGHNKYTDAKYYVTGTVTRMYANNIVISDDKGNTITIFGAYSADGQTKLTAMEEKPTIGDVLTVWGIVGQINSSARVKDGWIIAFKTPTFETNETPDVDITETETKETETEEFSENEVQNPHKHEFLPHQPGETHICECGETESCTSKPMKNGTHHWDSKCDICGITGEKIPHKFEIILYHNTSITSYSYSCSCGYKFDNNTIVSNDLNAYAAPGTLATSGWESNATGIYLVDGIIAQVHTPKGGYVGGTASSGLYEGGTIYLLDNAPLNSGTGCYIVFKIKTTNINVLSLKVSVNGAVPPDGYPNKRYVFANNDQWVTYVVDMESFISTSNAQRGNYLPNDYNAESITVGLQVQGVKINPAGVVNIAYVAVCDSLEQVNSVVGNDKAVVTNWNHSDDDYQFDNDQGSSTPALFFGWYRDGGYYAVAGFDYSNMTGEVNHLVIPDTYNGYPVKKIEDGAFEDKDSILTVTIPDSVTMIGNRAFAYCDNITSITIPDGVSSLGNGTFELCSNLSSVYIGANLKSIGEDAFSGCSNLLTITFAEDSKLETIGQSAFESCVRLAEIIIPETVKTISDYAFTTNYALESITISTNVTYIGRSAFRGCHNLTSIHYAGTTEQWVVINKGDSWDWSSYKFTVYFHGESGDNLHTHNYFVPHIEGQSHRCACGLIETCYTKDDNRYLNNASGHWIRACDLCGIAETELESHTYSLVVAKEIKSTNYSYTCICGYKVYNVVVDSSINYYSAPSQQVDVYGNVKFIDNLHVDEVNGFVFNRIKNNNFEFSKVEHDSNITNLTELASGGSGKYIVIKMRFSESIQDVNLVGYTAYFDNEPSSYYINSLDGNRSLIESDTEWTTYVIDLETSKGFKKYDTSIKNDVLFGIGLQYTYLSYGGATPFVDIAYLAIVDDWSEVKSVVGNEKVVFTNWTEPENDVIRNSDGSFAK